MGISPEAIEKRANILNPRQHTRLMDNLSKRAIAVFAHNESRRIIDCLEALRLSPLLPNTTCYVLANGCTDDTVTRATEYALTAPWVKVIDLKIGDKANNWNYFVYEIAPEAEIYFFTDGDCQIESSALQHLEECLLSDPHINAVSGVPSSRNLSLGIFRSTITSKGGFAGNLYALSQGFITRLRKKHVRLPHGLIGDDSLIGALALWDLDPSTQWNHALTRIVVSATFRYESIIQASLHDPMFYIRRLKRYSLRHFQNQLIKSRIKQLGLSVLPYHINTLYLEAEDQELIPRRSLKHYYFDYGTIRLIRNIRKLLSSSGR